jgi:hypothetical protein
MHHHSITLPVKVLMTLYPTMLLTLLSIVLHVQELLYIHIQELLCIPRGSQGGFIHAGMQDCRLHTVHVVPCTITQQH